jgi:multidrug efflux pump subunit AcrA (membrane-fusion protein)
MAGVDMDILHLVDRLEELFNEGRPIWFTHSVSINEEKFLDIIDQMRITIPEEIKKAQQLLNQHDRILAQAQEEANRTLQLAREKGEKVVEKDNVVQAAQVRSEQIISQARNEAEATRKDADSYALETLTRIEAEVEKYLNQIRNGIQVLQSDSQPKKKIEPR